MTRQRPRRQPVPHALSPLRDFLRTETAGGVLLALGAAVALVWANSPWSASYATVWQTHFSIEFAGHVLELTLREWINHGLITIFFFVVGLEVKREVVSGMLASRRAALLPVVAALGGMALPALIYLAIAGESTPRGWAIVVATDIPLALGVLALAARVPPALRIFLLALAIVDDIVALLIIAAAYSSGVDWRWLLAGAAGVAAAAMARELGVQRAWVYVAFGVMIWLALRQAGISPTVTGVAMGLLAPSTPRIAPELVDIEELTDVSTVHAARATTEIAKGSVSVVEWLEHVLHPWVSYVIVPLFALANAGITISTDLVHSAVRSPITWAILAGRVIGKPLGIMGAMWILVRTGRADWPGDAGRRQTLGVTASAGMGFTVALFVCEVALRSDQQRDIATLAIVVSAIIAGGASLAILGARRGERA